MWKKCFSIVHLLLLMKKNYKDFESQHFFNWFHGKWQIALGKDLG